MGKTIKYLQTDIFLVVLILNIEDQKPYKQRTYIEVSNFNYIIRFIKLKVIFWEKNLESGRKKEK